jgi:hypothetical protein
MITSCTVSLAHVRKTLVEAEFRMLGSSISTIDEVFGRHTDTEG